MKFGFSLAWSKHNELVHSSLEWTEDIKPVEVVRNQSATSAFCEMSVVLLSMRKWKMK